MQPSDGLLAHVAALGEADGALVEPRLLGDDRVVEVDAVARAPVLDAQHLRRRLVDLDGAAVDQGGLDALGVLAVADNVDADVRADEEPEVALDVGVLLSQKGLSLQRHVRVGADERQQAELERALVQLGVEADVEAAQCVEQGLQGRALAEQEQLLAGVEHAEVGEHLALRRQ